VLVVHWFGSSVTIPNGTSRVFLIASMSTAERSIAFEGAAGGHWFVLGGHGVRSSSGTRSPTASYLSKTKGWRNVWRSPQDRAVDTEAGGHSSGPTTLRGVGPRWCRGQRDAPLDGGVRKSLFDTARRDHRFEAAIPTFELLVARYDSGCSGELGAWREVLRKFSTDARGSRGPTSALGLAHAWVERLSLGVIERP